MSRQELILKRLAEEGAKTAAFFQTLTPEQFQQQVYLTGPQWRARDLLAHFVSAEHIYHHFGQQILAGGEGAPPDFVIDEFNATQVASLREATTDQLLAQFTEARTITIDMVLGMQDADFDRPGRHPWFGRVPLENMLKLLYRHTMLHERDIRKAVTTGQPVPHVAVEPPTQ